MGWVLRLVETEIEGPPRSTDVMEIDCPGDLGDLADLSLGLSEGKPLLARVQQAVVAAQGRDHAVQRPPCRTCGATCQVKDYRPHQIATLFGQIRPSHDPPAALPLCRLRRGGGGCRLAGAWPFDPRTRPAPSAAVRPDARPCCGWRARASSADRCRDRPRDPACPNVQERRGAG